MNPNVRQRDAGVFGPMRSGLAILGLLLAAAPCLTAGSFRFHHENILGTSMDLEVVAPDEAQAAAADTAALREVERLRTVLSAYDPASELSRLNVATAPMVCSRDLVDVLVAYDQWQEKSHGAYSGHLGDLIALWHEAEKSGTPPEVVEIEPILKALSSPGWTINRKTRTVTRLAAAGSLDVNSLGKGYIVTKAAIAARRGVPGTSGLLINIGGDIYASGLSPAGGDWEIGVADPAHSQDNAKPLTKVRIGDRAISTSGAYERGFSIGGKRYSHILDPRSGLPAEGVTSATVIANNNASANAMATSLCVLKPEEGLELVKSYPGAECLIVTADGRQLRSSHFSVFESTPESASGSPSSQAGGWPVGNEVSIAIELKAPNGGKRVKRPFVAVWVEDESGKRVRTVTVWGKERKYLPDLRGWWKVAKGDPQWASTVTRATRKAGRYDIAWDGRNDQGEPLPPGTYTIVLEANREHGTYSIERGTIVCGKNAATGSIPEGTEFGESKLSFGNSGK